MLKSRICYLWFNGKSTTRSTKKTTTFFEKNYQAAGKSFNLVFNDQCDLGAALSLH